ncbi:MAG: ATP-binding protein, partial [Planctomycetaceae bacterium]
MTQRRTEAGEILAIKLLDHLIITDYECQSLIVTINRPFENWTEVLSSERLTGATLDRLTHRCHILEASGQSYRLRDAKRRKQMTDSSRTGAKSKECTDHSPRAASHAPASNSHRQGAALFARQAPRFLAAVYRRPNLADYEWPRTCSVQPRQCIWLSRRMPPVGFEGWQDSRWPRSDCVLLRSGDAGFSKAGSCRLPVSGLSWPLLFPSDCQSKENGKYCLYRFTAVTGILKGIITQKVS